MIEVDELICKWLNVTPQQYQILKNIEFLNEARQSATPKNIEAKYRETIGKHIQNANLFGVLRTLQDLGYVTKSGSEYSIAVESMLSHLKEKRSEYQKEMKILTKSIEDSKELVRLISDDSEMSISIIDKRRMYSRVTELVKDSSQFYNISEFPSILFTPALASKAQRANYCHAIINRCLEEGLKVTYLTELKISRPFRHAMSLFGDTDRAVSECERVIENFCAAVREWENLSLYYTQDKPDWEIILPMRDYPKHFFLVLRSKEDLPGILHIESSDIAAKAYGIFKSRIGSLKKITPENLPEFKKRLLVELKEESKLAKYPEPGKAGKAVQGLAG